MATPTWNQITAPNFSAGNDLIAQAMAQLTKATTGFKSIADEYKDTIQKRNLGLIQEYVNSAKTPEELQSEGFQTGLAKLTENMRGEYDTSAKAQLVNKATDTLLSRKANQVSIARNEFGLTQDQLTAKKTENAAKLFALRNDPLAYKAEEQRQVAEGALDINAAQSIPLNVLNLDNATIDNRVKRESADSVIASALLDPKAKQANIDTAYGNLEVARKNATANMLQAEAAKARAEEEKNKNKNAYIGTGLAAIDNARKAVKEKVYGSGLTTDPEKSWKKWEEKATAGLLNFDPAPNKVVELIDEHPKLRELPDNLKILHAENALRYLRKSENFSNPAWWSTSNSEDTVLKQGLEESFKNFNQQARTIEDNATIPIYRKMVFEHAQRTNAPSGYAAAKDLGLDELTIYKAGIPSQLAAEAKIKYASSDKSIPEDQFIENEINIATNPDYGAENKSLFPKEPEPDYSKVSRPSPGRGAGGIKHKSLGVLPPTTGNTIADPSQEPSALAAQEQRINSRARLNLEAQKALQNGQPFIVPAITDKPVADPLRQAALEQLEQPPVATNNTSQPRQLPTAEIAQKGRKEQPFTFTDTPLKVLADAAKLKEATLPVVPAIAVKPEEVKSRELTPAEKQQEEHRTQAALSRLIGAKLEEKQALVRNAFPNASLTPINKATEPLSNNSIPLIQSMFKLPVITNTPKLEETKPRELTPLKELAKAATPVPSPLVPVESQNAFKSRDNNLSINLSTGKSVPSKDPVPMPKVSWGKPAEVVTMNPMVAKLPQYKAVATFVGDGDTFKATSKQYATKGTKANGSVLCRVDSVDAPETPHPEYGKKGQPYGEEAGKKLQQMILNKEISIRIVKAANGDPNEPGLYGRDICQIEVEGANVSTELIRAGAAWLYKEYNHYGQGGLDLEATARESKSGLWGLGNPVYPPDFRHNGYQNP